MKWNNWWRSGQALHAGAMVVCGLGLLAYFLWLQDAKVEEEFPLFSVAIFWILCLVFLLWVGNWLIYVLLKRWYPKRQVIVQRFVAQLLLSLVYTLLCINLSYYEFKIGFTNQPPDQDQLTLLNLYGVLFLLPVLSVQFGLYFMAKWKKAVVEQERLTKAQIQTELSALKAHLAPHFLFNNLNILSSLIQTQNFRARNFLDKFSEVYRYLLKNREEELIELREELQFLDAYSYLLKKRFEKELEIHLDIDEELKRHLVPPLVLQILLENVLKHNRLARDTPLVVEIYTLPQFPSLVVKNNLRPRSLPPTHGHASFGLESIRRRYWILSRQAIDVQQDEETFVVSLPLITPL